MVPQLWRLAGMEIGFGIEKEAFRRFRMSSFWTGIAPLGKRIDR